MEDEDAVEVGERRQPVRDHEHRLAGHQRAQAVLDMALGDRVQRTGRLVEQEDRRVLEDGARERDALPLAAGELHAALADQRRIAFLGLADELVRVRLARRRPHLLVARVQPAVADVLEQAAMEQHRVLRNHRDRAAQALLRDPRDVDAVDEDAALLEVEQAQHEVQQRALAAAGVADEADLLARADPQVQAAEHGPAGRVGEADVLERDLAAGHRQRPRAGGVADLVWPHDDADAVIDVAEVLEEIEELATQAPRLLDDDQRHARRHRELADAHPARGPEPDRVADDPEHQQHRRRELEPADRLHEPEHPARAIDLEVEEMLEVFALEVAPRKQLGVHDVGDRVDDLAADEAARGGIVTGIAAAALRQQEGDAYVGEHPGAEHGGERGVDLRQQGQRDDEGDRQRPEIEHQGPQHLRRAHRGFGDAVGQRAGEVAEEIALRVVLEVAEEIPPYPPAQRRPEQHEDGAARARTEQDAEVESGEEPQRIFHPRPHVARGRLRGGHRVHDPLDGVGQQDAAGRLPGLEHGHPEHRRHVVADEVQHERERRLRQRGRCLRGGHPCAFGGHFRRGVEGGLALHAAGVRSPRRAATGRPGTAGAFRQTARRSGRTRDRAPRRDLRWPGPRS